MAKLFGEELVARIVQVEDWNHLMKCGSFPAFAITCSHLHLALG